MKHEPERYWLCCGSLTMQGNHSKCFNLWPSSVRYGTLEEHQAFQGRKPLTPHERIALVIDELRLIAKELKEKT